MDGMSVWECEASLSWGTSDIPLSEVFIMEMWSGFEILDLECQLQKTLHAGKGRVSASEIISSLFDSF